MELHEGLAEYTGVRLPLDPENRIARTVSLLDRRSAERPTFVRSFAHLSGLAYGLLLDELDPDWLRRLTVNSGYLAFEPGHGWQCVRAPGGTGKDASMPDGDKTLP